MSQNSQQMSGISKLHLRGIPGGKPANKEDGCILDFLRFLIIIFPHLNQSYADRYFARIAFGSFDTMS